MAWLARPEHFQQVGSGAAVEGGGVVTVTVAGEFAIWATLPGGRADTIASQAGQLVLHSHEPDEAAVLDLLRRRHGQLAVAQALCEAGILEVYRAVCQLRGVLAPHTSADEVALAAARAESPECGHAISMFCGLLGDAAGRAALTFGAAGGVFVKGAIVARLGDTFARSPFRRRFDGAGRLPELLRAIPTFVTRGRLPEVAVLDAGQGFREYRIR